MKGGGRVYKPLQVSDLYDKSGVTNKTKPFKEFPYKEVAILVLCLVLLSPTPPDFSVLCFGAQNSINSPEKSLK
jgi:hypothetical protein